MLQNDTIGLLDDWHDGGFGLSLALQSRVQRTQGCIVLPTYCRGPLPGLPLSLPRKRHRDAALTM